MNPLFIGLITAVAMFVGALIGHWLRSALPDHHLNAESRDAVKLGVGLIATMSALVLGLVTASAKSSYDDVNTAVKHTAVDVLTLDRLLARYGPEAAGIRESLKEAVASRVETIWPADAPHRSPDAALPEFALSGVEGIVSSIRQLSPRDDAQRYVHSRALDAAERLLQTRWLHTAGTGSAVPLPFLLILMFWLTITFASFGLFAPRNATVLVVYVVCALSVGAAVFLILELDTPFAGLLKVSPNPLRAAQTLMNK